MIFKKRKDVFFYIAIRGVISIYSYFITEIISYHCEFRGRGFYNDTWIYYSYLMSCCPVNLQKLQLQCPIHCVDKQRVAFHTLIIITSMETIIPKNHGHLNLPSIYPDDTTFTVTKIFKATFTVYTTPPVSAI